MAMQSVEPCPIQRLGNDRESGSTLERGSLAQRRRGAHRVTQTLDVSRGLCEQPPRADGVATRLRDLAQRQACQRSRTLVPGPDLDTQCPLEERPGAGVLLAGEQELALSLARL